MTGHRRPSRRRASEFGGSPGLVQPPVTPDGDPGHTPDASELAMLAKRGDPEGTRLPEHGDAEAELAWNGLEPLDKKGGRT